MLKALEKYCGEVVSLGPLPNKFIILGEIINKFTMKIIGKEFKLFYSPLISKEYARILERRLKNKKLDVLFFVYEKML